MSIVTFDQPRRHERPSAEAQFRRSLDLADLAERIGFAAAHLKLAANNLTIAHALPGWGMAEPLALAKEAAADVFVALAEFDGGVRVADRG